MNVSPDLADLRQSIDPAVLGQRIKTARIAAGLTQAGLAKPEASVAYLSRIEKGERRPDLKLLTAFAEKTNSSLEDFLIGVTHDQRTELIFDLERAQLSLADGDAFDAMELLGKVRSSLENSPTSDLWPRIRLLDAHAHRVLGDKHEAIMALEKMVEAGPTSALWLEATVALTGCYLESGDPTRCIELGTSTLAFLNELGLCNSPDAVALAIPVATALQARGDRDQALEVCESVLGQDGHTQGSVAEAYKKASSQAAGDKNLTLAAELAAAGTATAEQVQKHIATAVAHAQHGELFLDGPTPDLDAAKAALAKATDVITRNAPESPEAARIQLSLAKAFIVEGDFDAAMDTLPAENDLTEPALQATRLILLGRIRRKTRKVKAAGEAFTAAATHLSNAEPDRATAQLWFELGSMFDEVGDAEGSANAYRHAARATGLTAPGLVAQAPAKSRTAAK